MKRSTTASADSPSTEDASRVDPGLRTPQRLNWVDYAKGIAICLVVIGHVNRGVVAAGLATPASKDVLSRIDEFVYTFHMPVFFFVGGMFTQRLRSRSLVQSLTSIISSIVYPYCVWATIQTLLMLAMARYTNSKATVESLWEISVSPPMQFWFLYVYGILVLSYLALAKIGIPRVGIAVIGVALWVLGAYDILPWAQVLNWIQFYALFFVVGDVLGGPVIDLFARRPSPYQAIAFATLFFASLALMVYWVGMSSWGTRTFCGFLGISGTLAVGYTLASLQLGSAIQICGIYSLEIYVLHTIVSAATRIGLVQICGVKSLAVHLPLGIGAGLVIPVLLASNARKYSYEWLFRLPLSSRR